MTSSSRAATHFVDVTSTSPLAPYTNWTTAALDIQSAVDLSFDGDIVLVTNGAYSTGGRAVYGTMTNRVAIDRAVLVQSVNGPGATIIQGAYAPGGTNGDRAVRCVYLTNGAVLAGFTLTNGATQLASPLAPGARDGAGGGTWCEGSSAVVSNCIIVGNLADWAGGGASGGTLVGCRLVNNWARKISSGTHGEGGGAFSATLRNSALSNNVAYNGGGASSCNLENCNVASQVQRTLKLGTPGRQLRRSSF